MSNDEPIEIRQENELEALKAIFGDDLKDSRTKTAWKVWKPLNITISLRPHQGSSGTQEFYAIVDLHIICSKNYPNEIPQILLENSKGMSKTTLQELIIMLKQKAKELIGEVMIFELTQCTQAFLYQHNKPGFKSFYEEMLIRQKEHEQQLELAKREETNRERQVILKEIQEKQKILKQELKERRERFYSDESSSEQLSKSNSLSLCTESSFEHDNCNHNGTQIIEFSNYGVREIQRGRCIGHYCNGKVIFYMGLDIETGETFFIGEWTIDITDNDKAQIYKQITNIEQEMNYLVKLKHPNVYPYVSIKQKCMDKDNKVIVYVLQEFINGLNCSFLGDVVPANVDIVRHISNGILMALEFLHRNNVVHKHLTDSSIFLSSGGKVKVANHSLYKRLSDLSLNHQSNSNFNKKTDILKFGHLILSLYTGTAVSEDYFEIPTNIPQDFHNFLSRCLVKEEKERYTATQLLNHPFVQLPIEKFSPKRNDETAIVRANYIEPVVNELPSFVEFNSAGGQSRVQSEFEVMQWIGKGAFGDVLKVRNKLDGGQYAIKRIELNPKNKQLNKKITREVKLLSKLNHENVVRYYNAWIESAIIENEEIDSQKTNSSSLPDVPRIIQPKELTFKNDIEALAPPMKDIEWSVSYEGKSKPGTVNDSSSNEESSDDEEDWGVRLMLDINSSESDGIEFERDSSTNNASNEDAVEIKETEKNIAPVVNSREVQFLYIQMEFCEKSTLRTAIDADLHLNTNRVWRLFREIIEGLAHIHQQGMIHRDLKPVNIFLDLNDHVKIGDFGLATTNILNKPGDAANITKSNQDHEKGIWLNEDAGDGTLTGQVGTALYTAPELNSTTNTIYNQKVDIYSLGIIFFEMCYISLKTQMERMKVLSGLRLEDVVFPVDFDEKRFEKQKTLMRWLLDHDISKRPTSEELLQSELVPPPLLEEEKLREMFRHTLSNPQLKAYKYLMLSCFHQPVTPVQDITYDMGLTVPNSPKLLQIYHNVRETVINIFKLHGGQGLSTPLLMPKSKYYDGIETSVKLMTHSGGIVSIPHDLRVPFARYVAWNNITLLRRYSIERVYREKKIFGFHPRELYECAFDIVTPTACNYMADAEILYIVNEIIDALPVLKNKNFIIRLNHTSLIKAILLHFGIKEGHSHVCNIISDIREGRLSKFVAKQNLGNYGLSENSITTLFYLMELEDSFPKVVSILQMITKKKSSEAGILAKQSLQELKAIIQNAEALGVCFSIVVSPGLMYNQQQYSGMMCQFVGELKKKRKRNRMDVIAAGGRYDEMITNYRNIKEHACMMNTDIKQTAVGISISLDKLVQGVQEEGPDMKQIGNLDVVVCSLGTKTFLKEKIRILKDLWAAGICCSLLEVANLEEIQEQCAELYIPFVILLKDNEQGTVRLCSWERDRFQEKTVNLSDLVEVVLRSIKTLNEGFQEATSVLTTKSENKIITCNEHTHEAAISIQFVTSEKLSANARRRYENQIRSQLDTVFKRFTGDVIVFSFNLESNIIRTLVSCLDFETEPLYQKSVIRIFERHQRNRKYLLEICDEIYEQKMKPGNPILILYSITDYFYKVLL